MKFQKRVPRDIRNLLKEQLAEYEHDMKMSTAEKRALHEWVSAGYSPYDNDMQICGDYGPLDFISAMRLMNDENVAWDTVYDTQTDEIVFRVTVADCNPVKERSKENEFPF